MLNQPKEVRVSLCIGHGHLCMEGHLKLCKQSLFRRTFGLVWFGLPKIVLFPYCDKNQYNLIHFWKAHGLYFNNLQKIANKQNCKFLLKYQVINLFVVLGVNVDLLILMDQLSNKNRKTIYSSSAPAPPPLQCPKTVLH